MDSSSIQKTFTSLANMDTTAPRFLGIEYEHTEKLIYLNDKFYIGFNEAISDESVTAAISIVDSDSELVEININSRYRPIC